MCCILVDLCFSNNNKHILIQPLSGAESQQQQQKSQPFCFGMSLHVSVYFHLLRSFAPNNLGTTTFRKHGSCHLHRRLRSLCLCGSKVLKAEWHRSKSPRPNHLPFLQGASYTNYKSLIKVSTCHLSICKSRSKCFHRAGLQHQTGRGKSLYFSKRGFLKGRWRLPQDSFYIHPALWFLFCLMAVTPFL